MNISKELQILIDAAIKDDSISSKEKKILKARAEKDGLDLDEFELYLNSLLPARKINWTRYGIISFVILFTLLWVNNYWNRNGGAETFKYSCNSIEDCLTKNEFEGARAHANIGRSRISYDDMQRIISAEVSFYLANNEHSFAVRSLREYNFEHNYENVSDSNNGYNEESDWYNQLVISLLTKISQDERSEWIEKIRAIAIKGKQLSSGFWDGEKYEFSLDNSIREQQLKLYKTTKNEYFKRITNID